ESLEKATELGTLADLVFAALTAHLPDAVASGIAMIGRRAAQTSECAELLAALPPLANTLRYGQARQTDADQLAALLGRLLVQAALALPYAARGLDQTAAAAMRRAVLATDSALGMADIGGEERTAWRHALGLLVEDGQAAPLLAGMAARLLYEAEAMTPDDAAMLLGRALSP